MKFKIIYILISFSSFFSVYSQSNITYSEYNSSILEEKKDSIKCKQEYNGNLRNGKYNSWYSNNILRCSGNFKNNMKIGIWKIYDKYGTLRVRMEFNKKGLANSYKTWDNNSNLIFEKYYNIDLSQNYTLDYKKFFFKEPDLIYSKRNYAYIENEKINRELFYNNSLEKEIANNIKLDSVEVYEYSNSPYNLLLKKIDPKLDSLKLKNYKIKKYEIEIIYFLTTKNDFMQKKTTYITPIYENGNGNIIKPYMIFTGNSNIITKLNNSTFWIYKEDNINDEILTKYYKSNNEKYCSDKVFNDILEYEIESWIK